MDLDKASHHTKNHTDLQNGTSTRAKTKTRSYRSSLVECFDGTAQHTVLCNWLYYWRIIDWLTPFQVFFDRNWLTTGTVQKLHYFACKNIHIQKDHRSRDHQFVQNQNKQTNQKHTGQRVTKVRTVALLFVIVKLLTTVFVTREIIHIIIFDSCCFYNHKSNNNNC